MKKITFLMALILVLASAVNAGQIVPKISMDKQTSATSKGSGSTWNYDSDKDTAISLGLEYLYNFKTNLNIGAGLEYQFDRKINKVDGTTLNKESNFSFMPFYLTSEYLIKTANENLIPFIKANLGYATYNVNGVWFTGCDAKGGLYWAIGGGINMNKNIKLELMYAKYNGSENYTSTSYDNEYSKNKPWNWICF